MTAVEKAAYLKGLVEGMGIDPNSNEGKLWNALGGLLSDMAHEIEDLHAASLEHDEALDEICDELNYLEELTCDLDFPEYEDDDEDDISVSKRIFGFIRALLAILLVLILLVITLRVGEAGGYLKLDWLRNGLGSRVSFVNTLFPEPAGSAAPTIPDVQ